jgi:hypothetical protein
LPDSGPVSGTLETLEGMKDNAKKNRSLWAPFNMTKDPSQKECTVANIKSQHQFVEWLIALYHKLNEPLVALRRQRYNNEVERVAFSEPIVVDQLKLRSDRVKLTETQWAVSLGAGVFWESRGETALAQRITECANDQDFLAELAANIQTSQLLLLQRDAIGYFEESTSIYHKDLFIARFQKRVVSAADTQQHSNDLLKFLVGFMVHKGSGKVDKMFDGFMRVVLELGMRTGGNPLDLYTKQINLPDSLLRELEPIIARLAPYFQQCWESLRTEASESLRDLMMKQEQKVADGHRKYAKKFGASGNENMLLSTTAWVNLYLSVLCATFVHVDCNDLAMQLYLGDFQERRVILPTMCIGFRVTPGDGVVLQSGLIPHCSDPDQDGACIMIAAFNSQFGK